MTYKLQHVRMYVCVYILNYRFLFENILRLVQCVIWEGILVGLYISLVIDNQLDEFNQTWMILHVMFLFCAIIYVCCLVYFRNVFDV